jgi:HAD superfamily hydrolase (TIGR01484 family)
MWYRLLALDIDGTLIGPDQLVAADVGEAVAGAEAAGLRICLATGRSYVESIDVWRQLPLRAPFEPMILLGGALVAEPDTGRTICERPMPRGTACEFADALVAMGHAAMAIVDGWRHDVDYFLTAAGDVHAASREWFAKMAVRVRRVERLADVPDLPPVLRISAVAEPDRARQVAAELAERFAGRLNVHDLVAPNYGVTIVEAHAGRATKLAALRYVAQVRSIPSGRIAAVGDDINDLPMLRGVGLGAAMPAAPPSVHETADVVATEGLAAFLRHLVAGRYDPEP